VLRTSPPQSGRITDTRHAADSTSLRLSPVGRQEIGSVGVISSAGDYRAIERNCQWRPGPLSFRLQVASDFYRSTGRETKPRLGRPRAVPRADGAVEPREEILLAAARLFTSVGFARATTRQIAAEAGLRQASLFHYFERKDDIYAELLDRTVQPALEFASRLAALEPDPAPGLYLLVLKDVRNFCREPGNLGFLQLQLHARSSQFSKYWDKRTQLRDEYLHFIEGGVRSGVFDVDDPDLATSIIFGLVESVVTWFSYQLPQSRHDVWQSVADYAVRSLLEHVSQLEEVRKEASRLSHRLDQDLAAVQGGRS
jgi:AcrR family transcriptional regulator